MFDEAPFLMSFSAIEKVSESCKAYHKAGYPSSDCRSKSAFFSNKTSKTGMLFFMIEMCKGVLKC